MLCQKLWRYCRCGVDRSYPIENNGEGKNNKKLSLLPTLDVPYLRWLGELSIFMSAASSFCELLGLKARAAPQWSWIFALSWHTCVCVYWHPSCRYQWCGLLPTSYASLTTDSGSASSDRSIHYSLPPICAHLGQCKKLNATRHLFVSWCGWWLSEQLCGVTTEGSRTTSLFFIPSAWSCKVSALLALLTRLKPVLLGS